MKQTVFLKDSRTKSDDLIQGEEKNSRKRRKKDEKEEQMVYVGISDTGKGISSKDSAKVI